MIPADPNLGFTSPSMNMVADILHLANITFLFSTSPPLVLKRGFFGGGAGVATLVKAML